MIMHRDTFIGGTGGACPAPWRGPWFRDLDLTSMAGAKNQRPAAPGNSFPPLARD